MRGHPTPHIVDWTGVPVDSIYTVRCPLSPPMDSIP